MKHQHLSQTKNDIAFNNRESAIARSSTHPIEELQGAIGNRAVNQLLANQPVLQAKPMFKGVFCELRSPTPLQAKPAKEADRPSVSEVQPENKTGLPDRLKAGIENYSGLAMDDVRVHYNSSKPFELQALAYTQGTDIHVAPGQETHLPHEAWHVVQQKQGRVKPTIQAKGVGINDDEGLEKEADVMGSKALQRESDKSTFEFLDNSPEAVAQTKIPDMRGSSPNGNLVKQMQQIISPQPAIQRVVLSRLYPLKIGGVLLKYYSTHDTKKEFDTKKEAWDYDTKLANESGSVFQSSDRVPTNATYYNTESRNVMGTTPQNPHTQSHASLAYRLDKRLGDTDFKKLRDQQILNKEQFRAAVEAEKPAKINPITLKRMLEDYDTLYDRLDTLLEKGASKKEEIHELMMRLIQMNPYSAYGKGKKTSKARIKGKGERKTDKFADAFDSYAKFNDSEGYEKFKKKRKKLYSDEENSSEEEKLKENPLKKEVRKEEIKVDYPVEGLEEEDNRSQWIRYLNQISLIDHTGNELAQIIIAEINKSPEKRNQILDRLKLGKGGQIIGYLQGG